MNNSSEKNYITIPVPKFTKNQTILVLVLVVVSFIAGSFWTKMQYLGKIKTLGVTTAAANNPTGITPVPQAAPTEDTSPRKVEMSSDPVLGDKNAPLTMIEFSDYECPFCKQYFTQTYPQLKKNYVDTGKLKIVFRNLPLSFHQNAHKEAEAALCAKDQGGDDIYWKFHDEVFTRTTSNGLGLALTELPKIANDVGISGDTLQQCLDSGKFTKKVDDDLAYSSTVGASATPTFFIGKSDASAVIMGTPIVGAQPYSAFQAALDKQLP